ncbi:hypothetical protein TDB9533_03801 [Thalassocella blandensis]|nr:hypothetical protein TDB9533_03801 [Thalassocella blandensis]
MLIWKSVLASNTSSTKKISRYFYLSLALLFSQSTWAELSTGVWFNYRYVTDSGGTSDERDADTFGDIQSEALILYLDDQVKDSPWKLSGEVRFGPGSFTDRANNSTGDNFTLHKAWLAYQFDENSELKIGKSQVPFGWKTVNFWPGDLLQAGYGDQMDVGVKFTSTRSSLTYDLAYYHADDWGETSTDTVDDNGHWGSSTTYRKVQTLVANALYQFNDQHGLGVSLQSGKLQDLTGINPENPVDGSHSGALLYYLGNFNKFNVKAEVMQVERSLPADYVSSSGVMEDIDNNRAAVEFGYREGNWYWYLDATMAEPGDQTNSDVDTVTAIAPGVSYDYGPGWFYFEALSQDGYVDRNGEIGEGDFSALYVSVDYYF